MATRRFVQWATSNQKTGSSDVTVGANRCLAEFQAVSESEPLQTSTTWWSSMSMHCLTLVVSRLHGMSFALCRDERKREEIEWETKSERVLERPRGLEPGCHRATADTIAGRKSLTPQGSGGKKRKGPASSDQDRCQESYGKYENMWSMW